ncbi:lipopolysaccharide biosynthesis protein [Isoptericola sp. NPDC058082]|uniref:lipopolysaccharide biosynthesis protein n=1 Tax=Isoptericola sp. NPDC058082 TaxID=3346331 RepID=UPI0036E03FE2
MRSSRRTTGPAPGHGRGDQLARAAAQGGTAIFVGQVLRAVVQAASLVVLARLLEPADFGLVAMVLVVVGIADVLRDSGMLNAAIQAPTLSKEQRDNLFWINMLLGAVAAAVTVLAAPLVAHLYGESELTAITRWLALTFLFNGIATQYRASLLRRFEFTATATIEVFAQVGGLTCAIVIAMAGGRYWALVAQSLTVAALICVGSAVRASWIPGPVHFGVSVTSFLRYGINMLAAGMVIQFSRTVDTLVVGLRFGPTSAGIYNRAFQFMSLPIQQLLHPAQRVAVPILARTQHDPQRFRRFLLRGHLVLLHCTMPVCALGAALAFPIVEIVFGPGWNAAAPILAALLVAGAFQIAGSAATWAFLTVGSTGSMLRLTLATRPLVIVAAVVASAWSPFAVACAVAASWAAIWPISIWWAKRTTPAPSGSLMVVGVRVLGAHGAAAIVAGLVASRVAAEGPWLQLAAGLAVAAAVAGVELAVWPALRRDLALLSTVARLGFPR